jgi:hypothetical protein
MVISILGFLLMGKFLAAIAMPVWATTALEQARNDFSYQYEQFRTSYSQYQLSVAQYQTSQTFAHEEEMLSAAKSMLQQRAQLWWTYFQALRTEVTETQGVPNGDRAQLGDTLQTAQSTIMAHKAALNTAISHQDLLTEANVLDDQAAHFQAVSYFTLSNLRQARLAYAATELGIYGENLRQAVRIQIKDEAVKAARLRGIDEAMQLINVSEASGSAQKKTLNDYVQTYQAQKLYSQIVDQLGPDYLRVVQCVQRLKELSTEIEL